MKLLTETELELMNHVWALGGATVGEIMDRLGPNRKLAYTSVSTMLRILEHKGVVKAEKLGRGHRYVPKLEKAEYESHSLNHLAEKLFGGSFQIAKHLVDAKKLSSKELIELKKMVDSQLERGKR